METPFKKQLPVAFIAENGKKIYARVLCHLIEDDKNIRCVTPHGSIFLVNSDKSILNLSNEDLIRLEEIEKDAMDEFNVLYNDLFNLDLDIEVK
jgi:hypothetical protein